MGSVANPITKDLVLSDQLPGEVLLKYVTISANRSTDSSGRPKGGEGSQEGNGSYGF